MRTRAILAAMILVLTAECSLISGRQVQERSSVKTPSTRYEQFLLRTGGVLTREVYEVGRLNGIGDVLQVKALTVSEAGGPEKAGAVELSGTYLAKRIVGFEELDFLIAALDRMLKTAPTAKVSDRSYFELRTATPSGLLVLYNPLPAEGAPSGYAAVGTISADQESAAIQLSGNSLGNLRALFLQAREKLVSLGAK